jgi:hypothetical protein
MEREREREREREGGREGGRGGVGGGERKSARARAPRERSWCRPPSAQQRTQRASMILSASFTTTTNLAESSLPPSPGLKRRESLGLKRRESLGLGCLLITQIHCSRPDTRWSCEVCLRVSQSVCVSVCVSQTLDESRGEKRDKTRWSCL